MEESDKRGIIVRRGRKSARTIFTSCEICKQDEKRIKQRKAEGMKPFNREVQKRRYRRTALNSLPKKGSRMCDPRRSSSDFVGMRS